MTTQHPVDSRTRACCNAIGGHAPDCANAPQCPDWCTQHGDGGHLTWLHARHVPIAPDVLVYGVYVSEGLNPDGTSFFGAPSIGMQIRDTIPLGFDPEQARRLAAALIRAAEIVEERLTENCEDCGTPIPEGVDGHCASCTVGARRSSLHVVEEGGR